MIKILAIAPVVIVGLIVYCLLLWVLPIISTSSDDISAGWIVTIYHCAALLAAWLAWGINYLEVF